VNPNPRFGSDSASTGAVSCPFRTISHAIAFLGASLSSDVQVIVETSTVPVQAGEQFPIVVPRHVHISGAASGIGGMPNVRVPAGQAGFVLAALNSSLSHLAITGQGSATAGIVALTGSGHSTTIDHLDVSAMAGNGIDVLNTPGQINGGVLMIGPGVRSHSNGSNSQPRSGLLINDSGSAAVSGSLGVTSGADQIAFNENTAHGITVLGRGALTLTGTAAQFGGGNVVTNANLLAGIWVQQTPALGPGLSPPPLNLIDGVNAFGNGSALSLANGLRLFAGSNVRVRRSHTLANHFNGIMITSQRSAIGTPVDDVTRIDLGSSPSLAPGRNVLQAGMSVYTNGGAGICLALTQNANQTLVAKGNFFEDKNCGRLTAPFPMLSHLVDACSNGIDLGYSTGNAILVDNCTQ
jgi:hypothetical protein